MIPVHYAEYFPDFFCTRILTLLMIAIILFLLLHFTLAVDPNVVASLKNSVAKKSYDASFQFVSSSTYEPVIWSRRAQLLAVNFLLEKHIDAEFIDLLGQSADFLVAHTSEALGLKDVVFNKPVVGWVTGGYSCGNLYAQEVHQGVTGESIALYIFWALTAPGYCDAACLSKVKSHLSFLERLVHQYDGRYRTSNGRGWYIWPTNLASKMGSCTRSDWASYQGTPLPYNMAIGMAQLRHWMMRIYALTAVKDLAKQAEHEKAVKEVALYFKDNLQYVADTQSYEWHYAENGRWEDVSHAVSDIRFVVSLVDHGPSGIFSATVLQRLANTFRWIVANPNKPYSHVVSTYGAPATDASLRQALAKWVMLAPVDSTVYNVAAFLTYSASDGDSQQGIAMVESHRPDAGGAQIYPRVTVPAYGDVFRPWGCVGPALTTGLVRDSAISLAMWDGKAVSSCVAARFHTPVRSVAVRHAHTANLFGLDTTTNNSPLGGLGYFSTSTVATYQTPPTSSWTYVSGDASSSTAAADQFVTANFALTQPVVWFAFCRAGAGHAGNNLVVDWFQGTPETPPMSTAGAGTSTADARTTAELPTGDTTGFQSLPLADRTQSSTVVVNHHSSTTTSTASTTSIEANSMSHSVVDVISASRLNFSLSTFFVSVFVAQWLRIN